MPIWTARRTRCAGWTRSVLIESMNLVPPGLSMNSASSLPLLMRSRSLLWNSDITRSCALRRRPSTMTQARKLKRAEDGENGEDGSEITHENHLCRRGGPCGLPEFRRL